MEPLENSDAGGLANNVANRKGDKPSLLACKCIDVIQVGYHKRGRLPTMESGERSTKQLSVTRASHI